MNIDYVKLTADDPDIPYLLEVHKNPETAEFISIDKDNFFTYVTTADGVSFYKIEMDGNIVGCLDTELAGCTLYISILTVPEYKRRGIATAVIEDLKAEKIISGFTRIIAAIEKRNEASVKLFEKSGFTPIAEFDDLIEYEWNK